MKLATGLLAIYFLVTGFIPRADYAELVKLPSLLEHYEFHITHEKKDISFLAFLSMHYNHSSQEEEDKNHEDLPFHHHEHCAGGILMFYVTHFNVSFIKIPTTDFFFIFPQIKTFIGAYFGNIWQPPCISV